MGYCEAGFDVVGVDIIPQKYYPMQFNFRCDDAIGVLECLLQGGALTFGIISKYFLDDFDAIHASPPCQGYGRLQINTKKQPKLIEPIRELLIKTGKLYVIENVVGAPLKNPTILFGSMFKLGVWRHRLFETNFKLPQYQCQHEEVPYPIDVTGTGGPCNVRFTGGGGIHRKPHNMLEANKAMGIDWMIRKDLVEAIPKAYTRFMGKYILEALNGKG